MLDQNVIRLNNIRPNNIRQNNVRQNDVRPNNVRPNNVRPNNVRPNNVRPNGVRPNNVRQTTLDKMMLDKTVLYHLYMFKSLPMPRLVRTTKSFFLFIFHLPKRLFFLWTRVARRFLFEPKNLIWANFGGPQIEIFVYFMAIWNIFTDIWDIS
jgi:hypothetical protein